MAQQAVRRALGKGDLRHESWLHPTRIAGDVARSIDERAGLTAQLGEPRAEIIERIGIKARADAPAIVQFAALELAQQQRGECAALLVGDAIAADDELLVAEALYFQ